jgi:hypothetical protein
MMRDGLFYFSEGNATNPSIPLPTVAASRDKVQADFGEALLRLTGGARSVSSDTIRQAHT